jgi:multisubunit Na+/H+ antiporter MnhB subunit
VSFVVLAAAVTAFVLLVYWRRKKSARRAYLYACYLALGLASAAMALMLSSDPSVSHWAVRIFAVLAVLYPAAGSWSSRWWSIGG